MIDQHHIRTYTGIEMNPLAPRPEDIALEDIAQALSLQCRFMGQIPNLYSVAQHSVLVSRIVPREDALWGLLHDAAEAYLGDLSRPLKRHPIMQDYCAAEARVLDCVGQRFGLGPMPASVVVADRIALATEIRELWGQEALIREGLDVEPLSLARENEPLCSRVARRLFLSRFRELVK